MHSRSQHGMYTACHARKLCVSVHGNRQGMATPDSGCLTFVEKSPVGGAYTLAVLETPTKVTSDKFTKTPPVQKQPKIAFSRNRGALRIADIKCFPATKFSH
jgi:hypothetical protein